MPTVVDSLVVLLGLDPSGYRSGSQQARDEMKRTRESAKSTADEIEASGKRAANFFGGLRSEVVGLFLAFAGANGLKDFVQQVVTGEAATGRLAKNIGLTTNSLSAWQEAVKTVGGDAKNADASLRLMNDAFQQLQQTGQTGRDAQFLALLGPQYRQILSQGPEETLLALAEASQRMDRPRFANLAGQLGLDDNTINLLEKGRAGVADLVEWERKHGAATDADAAAAQKLQEKLALLRSEMTERLRPAITDMVDWLTQALSRTGSITRAFGEMGDQFSAIHGRVAMAMKQWADFRRGDWKALQDDIRQDMSNMFGRSFGGKTPQSYSAPANGRTGLDYNPSNLAMPSRFGGVGGSSAEVLANIRSRESDGHGGYNAQAYNTANGRNAAGLSQRNLTGMTIGEVLDYQRNVMRPATRGRRGPGDVGSTGAGAYQFESNTLEQQAREVYGANYRNVAFSAANQDMLALHLYNSVKNSPARLARTWAFFAGRGGAGQAGGGAGGAGASGSSTMNIGVVNVYTPNAANFGRDLDAATRRRGLVTQSNSGLSG